MYTYKTFKCRPKLRFMHYLANSNMEAIENYVRMNIYSNLATVNRRVTNGSIFKRSWLIKTLDYIFSYSWRHNNQSSQCFSTKLTFPPYFFFSSPSALFIAIWHHTQRFVRIHEVWKLFEHIRCTHSECLFFFFNIRCLSNLWSHLFFSLLFFFFFSFLHFLSNQLNFNNESLFCSFISLPLKILFRMQNQTSSNKFDVLCLSKDIIDFSLNHQVMFRYLKKYTFFLLLKKACIKTRSIFKTSTLHLFV